MPAREKPIAFNPGKKPQLAQSRSVRHYQLRTGEIVWAWNHIHLYLQRLFALTATRGDLEMGNAIWHAIRSDSVQREALRAALHHNRDLPHEISGGAAWLLDVLGKLAPYRNDLAHAPTIPYWTEKGYVVPHWQANPAHWKRMNPSRNLRGFYFLLRNDLYALMNYAGALLAEAYEPGRYKDLSKRPTPKSLAPKQKLRRIAV